MTPSDVQILVSLSVPLIAFVGTMLAHLIYARLTPAQKTTVQDLAAMAVPAVEQACGLLSGDAKKAEATRIIEEVAGIAGVKVNPTLVSIAIEAAVYALNKGVSTTAPTALIPAISFPTA